MKTPKKPTPTQQFRSPQFKLLALAALSVLPAATGLAQTLWQGGTSDFNVATSWNNTYIDVGTSSPNPNCSDDSGSNNVVLIEPNDVAWYHGDTLAGNGNNTSGAYLQTGSTNNTGYPSNGNWLRLAIGTGSTGYYTLSNGVVNVAGQTHIGEKGTATLTVDGGVYNTGYNGNPGLCAGDGDFGTSTGTLILNGGTMNNIANETWIGEGIGCTGYWVMSGGTYNAYNWIAFGRNGGTGSATITGGAINFTSTGNPHIDVGASGPGTINQNGGAITNTGAAVWIGESGSGTWNLNSGIANLGAVTICVNGSASGTLNLNGGLLQASGINSSSSGFSTIDFNGSTVQASATSGSFISGIKIAGIDTGGVIFDSQGYNITIPEALSDNGGGTLTKIGSGTLTLTGGNSYNGATVVSAGTLAVTTAGSTDSSGYSVAAGAAFSVQVASAGSQFAAPGMTFASGASTLDVDLNTFGTPSAAPLNAGPLVVNGTVTLNISAEAPVGVGTVPLVQYISQSGSGNFVLGTLPVGESGHLSNSGGLISLVITSAGAPKWNGNVNGTWDVGTTANWIDAITGNPTTFQNGEPVLFDDTATGTTNVVLNTTVTPAAVTYNNSVLPYTLTGSGAISGITSLTKEGTANVTLLTGGNTYTGPTLIQAGSLTIANLANGGSPSPIGAASASPTNLVIGDGTLSYQGAAVTANRGFTIEGTNATIDAEGSLTLGGNVTAVNNASDNGSALTKVGLGQLALTGSGDNEFSVNASVGVAVRAGTLLINGTGGNQTNHTQGQMYIGNSTTNGAAVILTNASVKVDSWLAIGRINGDLNNTSSITLYNSAISCGNLSLGWDGGLPNNLSSQFVTLNGNSSLTNYGAVNMPEGANSSMTLAINGSSTFWVQNPFYICLANSTTGAVVVANSGEIVQTGGWFDIGQGQNCLASLLAENSASLVLDGDLNLADTASGATATLTVQDSATVTSGTLYVGKSTSSTCTVNLTGAGSITCRGIVDVAGGTPSTGTINIGSVSQPGGALTAGGDMTLGDNGTGVLNMVTNGGGVLTVPGTLYLSRSSQTANGTVNLNAGSTIVANYVNNGWGFHNNYASPLDNPNAFNFNGGTLKAGIGSSYFMQPYVNAVVEPAGAIINDNGYTITVLAPLVTGGGNGGLTKQGTGTLYLTGVNTYTGLTTVSTGAFGSSGTIAGPVTVNSGATLLGDAGTIGTSSINNSLTLSSGSTTVMQITPASNDTIQGLTTVSYGGALVVTNSGGALTAGSMYQLFHAAGAGSGNFSSVTLLPSGTATFNPATGFLTIGSTGTPTLNGPTYSGGNLILTGSGGTPSGNYDVITATNLLTPLANWTTNVSGTFSASGTFSNAIPVSTSQPMRFFRLAP